MVWNQIGADPRGIGNLKQRGQLILESQLLDSVGVRIRWGNFDHDVVLAGIFCIESIYLG